MSKFLIMLREHLNMVHMWGTEV